MILHLGDCLEVMRTLPEQSANCCVTSPPYFGLRDYGHSDQIGLEATPDEFVAKLVAVFREVRRVLQDDGTLWLNLGDSYNAYNANRGASTSISDGTAGRDHPRHHQGLTTPTLKNKDLLGIPWRVAFALQSDGWYLRQDIIWHKPNPMPESVTDRCTKSHEYVFLLSKSARYYYDAEAIAEQAIDPETIKGKKRPNIEPLYKKTGDDGAGRYRCNLHDQAPRETRNRRDVWTIATKPFHGAHFAVMPPALVEPCILAGCPMDGVVLDPFTGSGTVGEVALLAGRRFVGIELNPEYHAIAQQRIGRAAAAGYQPSLLEATT